MTVYIVTTGSYSDYRIDSVWSTKAQAEQLVAHLQRCGIDDAEIAEWTVDHRTDPLPVPEYCVRLNMTTGAVVDTSVAVKIEDDNSPRRM